MVAERQVYLPFRGVEREIEFNHADLAVAFDGGAYMFQGFLNEMTKLHMVFLPAGRGPVNLTPRYFPTKSNYTPWPGANKAI